MITRRQLTKLPAIGGDDGGGADKATQAGPVRPKDDRHVAGEVDGADGIGIVVDVRRMQAGLAAVGARPCRFRSDQAHAGTAGVVVHLPCRGEEGVDIAGGEKIRCAMRPVHHVQRPVLAVLRVRRLRQGGKRHRFIHRRDMQDITGAQCAPAVSAELAQGEGGAAAQVGRDAQAAVETQVAARAGRRQFAQRQGAAGADRHGLPGRQGLVVEQRLHGCAGQRDNAVAVEAQGGAGDGALESRGIGLIAQQAVAIAKRQVIHGARWRDTDIPVTGPAGVILHRGLGAGREDIDAAGLIGKVVQGAGVVRCPDKAFIRQHLLQVIEIGLDALDGRLLQGAAEFVDGAVTVRGLHDELGQHGIVEGRHLAARLDPGLAAYAGRKCHMGQQSGRRLELPRRILCVEPCLHGMTGHVGAQRVQVGQFAGRQAHHPFHQVDTGHRLGNAMLDLQARVHLQKIKGVPAGVVDVFHRAGGTVVDRSAQAAGTVLHMCALRAADAGCRRLLDDLLVAALQAAVALAQRDDLAGAVAEDLHLHVAGVLDILFEEDAGIGEVVA